MAAAEGSPLLPLRKKSWRARAAACAAATVLAIATLARHERSPLVDFGEKKWEARVDRAPDVKYVLIATSVMCAPDKTNPRPCLVFNGTFPGPTIRVKKDQVVEVTVVNALGVEASGLTVHHHGVHQLGTPFNDGAEGIAQAAIPPGKSYAYKFVAAPRGTHFYHSHVGVQYGDGLAGAFIVEDPDEPNPSDQDEVLVVQDYMVYETTEDFYATKEDPSVYSLGDSENLRDPTMPTFMSTMVNGVAKLNVSSPQYELEAVAGHVLKLRLVFATWGTQTRFRIQAPSADVVGAFEPFVVVAVDGRCVRPVSTTELHARAGERYDVLLRPSQAGDHTLMMQSYGHAAVQVQASGSFGDSAFGVEAPDAPEVDGVRIWMPDPYADPGGANRTNVYGGAFVDGFPATAQVGCNATLRVVEARARTQYPDWPPRPPPEVPMLDLLAHGARPTVALDLANEAGPPAGPPDLTLPFVVTAAVIRKGDNDTVFDRAGVEPPPAASQINSWLLNNNAWMDPTAPLYLTKGRYGVSRDEGYQTAVFDVPMGAVVDLVVMNNGGGSIVEMHPFHLHGYSFWVIAHDQLPYVPERAYASANYVDPLRLDTLPVRTGEYAILRIRADNPGLWHFHCHLLIHMALGIQAALNVAEADQPFPPRAWFTSTEASYLGAVR